MFKQVRKSVSIVILIAFICTSVKSPAYAQMAIDAMPRMPMPGVMLHLSPEFTPAYLKGITIHPENALNFDFIVYRGDKLLSQDQKKQEYNKLIKYFLASLTIPDDDQWVNLSPYEKDRIIKDDFGKTEMGRDLLAEDYILKQITASLIYPESNLGRKFWDKVYAQAQEQFGSTNIPVNTFNKVWIVPDDALVYEKGNTCYVINFHLKVMLEEDYLSLKNHSGIQSQEGGKNLHSIASNIVRQIVLPELEKEINGGENFATLRQVFSGVILAAWFKRALKQSLLGQMYANKAKVKGVDQDPKTNEEIYYRYLSAYKKGVFNYIKNDVDKYTNEVIPRKYFSGGIITRVQLRRATPQAGEKAVALESSQEDDASAAMTTPEASDAAMTGLSEPLIDFRTLTPDVLQERVEKAREILKEEIDKIIDIHAEDRTFENTVAALDIAVAELYNSTFDHPEFGPLLVVSPDERMRNMAREIDKENKVLVTTLYTNERIYNVIKEYQTKTEREGKWEQLDGEKKMLFAVMVKKFEDNGIGLPQEKKERVIDIRKRLSEIEGEFQNNVGNHRFGVNGAGIEASKNDLQGVMTEDQISKLDKSGEKYLIYSLTPGMFKNFMDFCNNAKLREQLYLEYYKRAPDNRRLVDEARGLRSELAQIFGYVDYDHYAIRNRMAQNPEEVVYFLNDLKDRLIPLVDAENAQLLREKQLDDPRATKLENWDIGYYQNKLKKRLFAFDPQEVRRFFPLKETVDKMLGIFEEILGVKFTEVQNPEAWSDDVRLFEVSDQEGNPIGQFYLDLSERKGKAPGARHYPMALHYQNSDGTNEPTMSVLIGSFSDLLTHGEIVILSHEFGHLMHSILTKAKYPSLAGVSVAQDAVEIPSMMFENFAWQPAILKAISSPNGSEHLSDDVITKMIGARNVGLASLWLRQVGFSLVDLKYYAKAYRSEDSTKIYADTMQEMGIALPEGTHFQSAWAHPIGDFYAAGYYSYPYSLVIAQDLFGRFEEGGIRDGNLDPNVGKDFRTKILEPGGTRPMSQLVKNFLGRSPNSDAFLHFLGIENEAMITNNARAGATNISGTLEEFLSLMETQQESARYSRGANIRRNLRIAFDNLGIRTVPELLEKSESEFSGQRGFNQGGVTRLLLKKFLSDNGLYLKDDPADPKKWIDQEWDVVPLDYLIKAEFRGDFQRQIYLFLSHHLPFGRRTISGLLALSPEELETMGQKDAQPISSTALEQLEAVQLRYQQYAARSHRLPNDLAMHAAEFIHPEFELPSELALGKEAERLAVEIQSRKAQLRKQNFEPAKQALEAMNPAMATPQVAMKKDRAVLEKYGGIDMNAANLNLHIKRDGNGVPLPVSQQDRAQLAQVDGLVPVIVKIIPETASPSYSSLQIH